MGTSIHVGQKQLRPAGKASCNDWSRHVEAGAHTRGHDFFGFFFLPTWPWTRSSGGGEIQSEASKNANCVKVKRD